MLNYLKIKFIKKQSASGEKDGQLFAAVFSLCLVLLLNSSCTFVYLFALGCILPVSYIERETRLHGINFAKSSCERP